MRTRRYKLLFFLLISYGGFLHAQTINITLPKFADQEYVWVLNSGIKQDTILKGKLDANGKTKMVLPAQYAGYKGMSSFRLAKGGGLDLIVNNENFTAASVSEKPNLDNISFTGSPENSFLVQQYKEQSKLKGQLGMLQNLQGMYKPSDVFYAQVTSELKKVTHADAMQQSTIKKSPLYAARFLQIREYLERFANYKNKPEDIKILRQDAVNVINSNLYSSSLWKYTINYWAGMHHDVIKDDNVFTADAITLLKANSSNAEILNELGNNLVDICEQNGWEKSKMQIAFAIFQSGMLPSPTGNLAQVIKAFSAVPGNIAPDIELRNGVKLSSLTADKLLVIFYETGCGHCDDELTWLRQNYQQLHDKGIMVISIGADLDPKISATNTDIFPWTEKLCDFKGFQGINFKNYGVIGTPTIFIIDQDKKITGKYAKAKEAGLL